MYLRYYLGYPKKMGSGALVLSDHSYGYAIDFL